MDASGAVTNSQPSRFLERMVTGCPCRRTISGEAVLGSNRQLKKPLKTVI